MNNVFQCSMGSIFKKLIFMIPGLIAMMQVQAQVTLDLKLSPPFTPFISDYVRPERIEDIHVSLFNAGSNAQRLKFRFSIKNAGKGIEIAIKESTIPRQPLILNPNEFRLLKLEDVSDLYGKLDQKDFDIKGTQIQSLLLDGTIPDGLYEVCVQAFDFDAPGFTKPISQGSPMGCFTFNINYTDPATDIRFNQNLLQYSFGGLVPLIGVNADLGQNYYIQFTPPAFNIGSSYEYTLSIYDQTALNPAFQREADILESIRSVQPIIQKTSQVPFFTILPSDLELDLNKNYFLLIHTEDIQRQTLFKNKGYSAFKAFHLYDNAPLLLPQPSFDSLFDGKTFKTKDKLKRIEWSSNIPARHNTITLLNNLEIKLKIVRLASGVMSPPDVFSSNLGDVLIDTTAGPFLDLKTFRELNLKNRFGDLTENDAKKWVIGIQYRIKPGTPNMSHIQFENNGKTQIDVFFENNSAAEAYAALLIPEYPLNNDTLPFQYPPVVINAGNLVSSQKIAFTEFNSSLELFTSNKYLMLRKDTALCQELNAIGMDTVLTAIARELNMAGLLQGYGSDEFAETHLNRARRLLELNYSLTSVQIAEALNSKYLPLGNGSNGKLAILKNVFEYNANASFLISDASIDYPNIANIVYINPYKSNITWTARVGIYSDDFLRSFGMSMPDYEQRFRSNSFYQTDFIAEQLRTAYKSSSGSFHVGMMVPQLKIHYNGRKLNSKIVRISFLPSPKPRKLLPSTESNEAWKEFENQHVSQQWNLEISRDKMFQNLDTLISKKISKTYNLSKDNAAIIADLYTQVDLDLRFQEAGKYYWRVTWSNPVVNDSLNPDEIAYYKRLGNLLGAAQLIGQMDEPVPFDSLFFVRRNYKFSEVDSFEIADSAVIVENVKVPSLELIYPLPDDTIPFYYPPVVIRNQQSDSAYAFALTKFNSTLEPFYNQQYFVFDSVHPKSTQLRQMSYDSLVVSTSKDFDALAKKQLLDEQLSPSEFEALTNQAITQNNRNTHLEIFNSVNSGFLLLGSHSAGKLNLHKLVMKRNQNDQNFRGGESEVEFADFGNIVYSRPFKNVNWDARIAYFDPGSDPNLSIDSLEFLFSNNNLNFNSFQSEVNQQGLAFFSGNFHVGMKTPLIERKHNGAALNKNNVEITFRPSSAPRKLFPESDANQAWRNWQDLFVAQQWNIEVSETPDFDSLVFVKSKCIIQRYSIPGSNEAVMNDLYNLRTEKLNLSENGKYYYRITWSNPVSIDSANPLHLSFHRMQQSFLFMQGAYDSAEINQEDQRSALELFHLQRVNYKFSEIDSFVVVDGAAIKDTAQCGLNCQFAMSGVSMQPAANHILVNDEVDVGLFKMTIKTISSPSGQNTFTGTGTIRCNLIPGPIAVTFKDVRFNADRRLIEGQVKAAYHDDDFMSSLATSVNDSGIFGKIASRLAKKGEAAINQEVSQLTSGEVENIYDYFNSPACLLLNAALGAEVTMPFGLSKEVDNFPYTIAITDIVFKPDVAHINAAAILKWNLFDREQFFGFGAMNVCLTPGGLGDLSNGGALELLGDVIIPISDDQDLRIVGRKPADNLETRAPGTRLVWDCKGFKHIDLKVSLEMDTSFMVPIHDRKRGPGQVTATGHTVISSLNNWLLTLDFDTSFQLKDVPDLTFKSRRATLDFSNMANAQGMIFPAAYTGDRSNNWFGIYIQDFEVRLPDIFDNGDTLNGLAFSAQNVLIDQYGFTANLGVSNILSLSDGSLAGWKFSIDRFGMEIVQNVPRAAVLNGQMGVPVFQGTLAYSLMLGMAINSDTNMRFTITPSGALTMPGWFAAVNLLPSSSIEMLGDFRKPNSIVLQSNLNGDISLGQGDIAGFKDVSFGTLPFEGFKVSTGFKDVNFFRISLEKLGGIQMNRVVGANNSGAPGSPDAPGAVQSSGPLKTGGFPISIQDFSMDTFVGRCLFDVVPSRGSRIGIKFKLVVNVTQIGPVAIGGQCNVGLYATPDLEEGIWGFKPAGINLDTILIDAQLNGAFTIKGGLVFISGDPVYGNGIAGFVSGNFADMFMISVSGMMGNVDGFRYWMFGASLGLNPGIPIDFSANVIYANYISGELWSNMNRTPGTAADAAAGAGIGRSPSGASFVPDRNAAFGLGIALGVTGPPSSPLYGNVGLYAQFTPEGGLGKLTIEGNMWMTERDPVNAQVYFNGSITVDVTNQKLIGSMSALVNVAGGIIRGRIDTTISAKTYYIAGSIDLLIDFNRNLWHLKLGNPFISNGKLGLAFYTGTELIFNAGGYFMMGNNLPQSLPPMDPVIVQKIRALRMAIPSQRPPAGDGFAIFFGLDANIPEKKIELGMFYAGLSVSFAMDGMLNQQELNCANRNGIGGWYSTGRAYAVVNGVAGMHVETPFYSGDVIVAELNAGMILDAGMPNPYYFKGSFSANYSILGGLIQGSKQFQFELAEDVNCKPAIASGKASFGQIVSDVSPGNNQTSVLVGLEPSIAFNFALDKPTKYSVPEEITVNGQKVTRTSERSIRVVRDYIQLKERNSGQSVGISTTVSDNGLLVSIRPTEFLKAEKTKYQLNARFYVQKLDPQSNTWTNVKRSNGRDWDTVLTVYFETEQEGSLQPDYISYSTPMYGENFFKKGDHTTGQLVFKQNNIQNTFFGGTLPASGTARQIALANGYNIYYGMLVASGNPSDTTRVALTFSNNLIQFPIPSSLSSGKTYQFRLIKERVPGFTVQTSSSFTFNTIGTGINLRKTTAGNQADRRMIMYAYAFKVSKYQTMADKLNQLQLKSTTVVFTTSQPMILSARTGEHFERYEVTDNSYPIPNGTINIPATFFTTCSNLESDKNAWMKDFYFPKVYKAGDTLQRKFPTFDGPYLNRIAFTYGSGIYLDNNIKEPLPPMIISFDLRLADQNLNSYQSSISQMVNTSMMINSGTNSQVPDTLVNIEYIYYLLMNSDFQRLKSLANSIYNRPLNSSRDTWKSGLSQKEQELVTRVRSSSYFFTIPFNTESFKIGLHSPKSSYAIKYVSFNSNQVNVVNAVSTAITTTTSSKVKAIKKF